MVRPSQVWDRREDPKWAATVLECGAGKVTYLLENGNVVTTSKFTFKKIYKRRRQLPKPTNRKR